jgi:hypothetical protein
MTEPDTPAPETSAPRAAEPTRVTPHELAFGEAGLEQRLFETIEREAELLAVDPLRLDHFSLLGAVTEALREIVPPDAPPDAREQHRAILFHAFNFWRFGKRLYFLESAVARYLVEAAPEILAEELSLPHPSVYLQLPANLFWASIAPDTPPEPVDGFFVTGDEGADAFGKPFRHFFALMVLGIRRNRAGFSVIPFEVETGPGIAAEWAVSPGRATGRDFENVLPGGEISGMYSILTTAEALKLLARALSYIEQHPDAVSREDPAERRAADRPGAVRYSRLAFHRVTLGPAAPAEGGG